MDDQTLPTGELCSIKGATGAHMIGESGQIEHRKVDPCAVRKLVSARRTLLVAHGSNLSMTERNRIRSLIAIYEGFNLSGNDDAEKRAAVPSEILGEKSKDMPAEESHEATEQTNQIMDHIISEVAEEVDMLSQCQTNSMLTTANELRIQAIETISQRVRNGEYNDDNKMPDNEIALGLLRDFSNAVKNEAASQREVFISKL